VTQLADAASTDEELRAVAHSLEGVASNFGLTAVHLACKDLHKLFNDGVQAGRQGRHAQMVSVMAATQVELERVVPATRT
jgi:HPt (histidine-containing phosphotransfer) domain-containing protein